MIVIIKLILAHFLGDFLLQPTSWVKEKETKKVASPKLYLHILIHGALVLVILWNWSYWLLAAIIVLLHGAIDLLKLYFQKKENKTAWFLIDQALHLVSLLILWYFWFQPAIPFTEILNQSALWIYAAALVLLTIVSGIVIKVLLEKWTEKLEKEEDDSLNSAGKYIGILERLFVFTFILTGNWGAIGFLIAAKSVFRFGDLRESKNRKLTEYILIGTLLSFGIAIATGMAVLELMKN